MIIEEITIRQESSGPTPYDVKMLRLIGINAEPKGVSDF